MTRTKVRNLSLTDENSVTEKSMEAPIIDLTSPDPESPPPSYSIIRNNEVEKNIPESLANEPNLIDCNGKYSESDGIIIITDESVTEVELSLFVAGDRPATDETGDTIVYNENDMSNNLVLRTEVSDNKQSNNGNGNSDDIAFIMIDENKNSSNKDPSCQSDEDEMSIPIDNNNKSLEPAEEDYSSIELEDLEVANIFDEGRKRRISHYGFNVDGSRRYVPASLIIGQATSNCETGVKGDDPTSNCSNNNGQQPAANEHNSQLVYEALNTSDQLIINKNPEKVLGMTDDSEEAAAASILRPVPLTYSTRSDNETNKQRFQVSNNKVRSNKASSSSNGSRQQDQQQNSLIKSVEKSWGPKLHISKVWNRHQSNDRQEEYNQDIHDHPSTLYITETTHSPLTSQQYPVEEMTSEEASSSCLPPVEGKINNTL